LPAGGLTEESLPGYRERIEQNVLKSIREAKRHTSWLSPNPAYEDGVLGYVRSILARVSPNPVLTELQSQADALAFFGAFNSASLVTLKLTAPGVPDLYQGNELIDLSLVDPDNRRPVDYAERARLLDELAAAASNADVRPRLAALAATPQDGRLKLWVTWRLLQLRRTLPTLFRDGGYEPLRVDGLRENHVVAFARVCKARGGDAPAARALTIVGRFHARLLEGRAGPPTGGAVWEDTSVEVAGWPDGTPLRNALTGETVVVAHGRVALARVFATLPLAVLTAG
jgi:(1->4)-alpha-D-glucan 1-alpha-D-glucosylmutase